MALPPFNYFPPTVPASPLAGRCDNELGASRCAPSSTPTANRSTSSPPSHPVTTASPTATNDSTIAIVLGDCGAGRRKYQLTVNSSTTTTFPTPCKSPIRFAHVPEGIADQSTSPNTAANKPLMIPTTIIQ